MALRLSRRAEPKGGANNLIAQLDSLPEQIEYVMRLDEDLLFLSPVDGERLNAIAEEVLRADLVYVSLLPIARSLLGGVFEFVRRKLSRQPLRPLSFSEPYYSSLNPAIWKRSYLRDLLRQPGNVWEFEHIVTDKRHYAVWERVLDFDAIVAKGKWLPTGPAAIGAAGSEPCQFAAGNSGHGRALAEHPTEHRFCRRGFHELSNSQETEYIAAAFRKSWQETSLSLSKKDNRIDRHCRRPGDAAFLSESCPA